MKESAHHLNSLKSRTAVSAWWQDRQISDWTFLWIKHRWIAEFITTQIFKAIKRSEFIWKLQNIFSESKHATFSLYKNGQELGEREENDNDQKIMGTMEPGDFKTW